MKVEENGKQAITDKAKRKQERNVEKEKLKREKCPTNDDKEKENIATLFFASFFHVRGVQIHSAPENQKVLHFSQFLYRHTTQW